LFSHAVRWEFCGHNPISSGIPVGSGGKRGPSTGVRISAKRQRSPWFCSPEEVKLGLAELEFRDQLLVFLEGALVYVKANSGPVTLAVVRFRQHEHQRPTFVLLASRWKPEEHKNGSVCKTVADASKPKIFLAGVEIAKPLQQTGRFCIPFRKTTRHQAVRSSFSVKEEDSACIQTNRNHGCGLAHVRHSVGTMLAEMGEHQLTIRDYLRHSNLHVTNKYLQATSKTKRLAQDKLVDAILPTGILPKTNPIQ